MSLIFLRFLKNKEVIATQKLIYVPPGGSSSDPSTCVTLEAADPYILSEIRGLGGVEANVISATVPGMDGAYLQNVRIEPREIPCTVYVRGRDRWEMYANRHNLIKLLTPSAKLGWLYYRNDYIFVRTQALPRLPPDFSERIRCYNKAEIAFWCPSPYWKSFERKTASIGYIDGSEFKFPFSFPVTFASVANEVTIQYNGSIPAPVRIVIHGAADAPKITNTATGKTIAITGKSLTENQRLVIYTVRGGKQVLIADGSNVSDAFQYIDPASEFWELQPGENRIVYDSADDTKTTRIEIEYTELYLGV